MTTDMIRPSFLSPGSRIRIVSPAGIIDPNLVYGAASALESEGFEVVLGEHVFARSGRFAGTDAERLADLQAAIDDPRASAILCSRGGYGLSRIIDRVDFRPMGLNPKWLVGFSDISVLHNALSSYGVESLHAGMCRQLVRGGAGAESLVACLRGELPSYRTAPHALNVRGRASGRLTGGNLSLLYALKGTPFDIMPSDRILFIEDLSEPAYHIDRMLQSLRLAGVFDKIAGLVVGQFTDISGEENYEGGVYGIINELAGGLGIPVCYDFPAGHIDDNMPLVMGAETLLEVGSEGAIIKQK